MACQTHQKLFPVFGRVLISGMCVIGVTLQAHWRKNKAAE